MDLEDIQGNTAYAEYDMFSVTSEKTKYQLSLGIYSGEHCLNWFHFPFMLLAITTKEDISLVGHR